MHDKDFKEWHAEHLKDQWNAVLKNAHYENDANVVADDANVDVVADDVNVDAVAEGANEDAVAKDAEGAVWKDADVDHAVVDAVVVVVADQQVK